MKKIGNHFGRNIVGYVALFVALSGSAYAAGTIGSRDIRPNAVLSRHLARNAVHSNDIQAKAVKRKHVEPSQVQVRIGGTCPAGAAIRNVNVDGGVACETDDRGGPPTGPAGGSLAGTYPNPTLAPNSVGSSQLANGAVNSAKVLDGSLTGDDIDESALGQVPSSLLGGFGRFASDYPSTSSCDPNSLMLIICISLDLSLPAPARVLVIGTTNAVAPYTSGDEASGTCELGSSVLDLPETFTHIRVKDPGVDTVPLVGITPPLGPGTVQFRIRCNESEADIFYTHIRIAAVALSPS